MVKRQKAVQDDGNSTVSQAVSLSVSGRSRIKGTRRKRLTRAQVMKMLSLREGESSSAANNAGTSQEPEGSEKPSTPLTPGMYDGVETSKEFLSSGRTGRRNALPDILGQNAGTGTGDLPARLEALTTDADQSNGENGSNRPSTSKEHTG